MKNYLSKKYKSKRWILSIWLQFSANQSPNSYINHYSNFNNSEITRTRISIKISVYQYSAISKQIPKHLIQNIPEQIQQEY